MVDFLKELNDVQYKAVVNIDGPSLIIAGAGSGKTRVLTYRIAYLLSKGVEPHSVLALTFTNKAAKEMKERIGKLVGVQPARRLWMGTFHSIFARILRSESESINFKSSFTIYDTTDSRSVVKAAIRELNLDDSVYKPADVLSRISMAKNHLVTAQAYAASAQLLSEDAAARKPRIADVYRLYAQKCRLSDAMDFDDLLLNTNILFRDHPEVLAKYQNIFRYILVDEYQDTNRAQYLIVKKLAEKYQNVCVVGDDAQSIYSFRGARIENILNFRNDYPDYKEYKLEQNYRSTQTIVNAANSVIRHNSQQLKKKSFSEDEQGEGIGVIQSYTDQEEAFLVASSISETLYAKRADYSNFAILYRTNAQSRALEDALRRKNIPYRVFGGLSFYQRAEVKDMIAYLRLAVNHDDDESFKRVVNYPIRGIGDTTMQHLQAAANEASASLWDTLKNVPLELSGIRSAAAGKLQAFVGMIESLTPFAYTMDAYEYALTVAKQSGMISTLRDEKTAEGIAKYENLEELLNSIKEYCDTYRSEEGEDNAIPRITDYLQNIALITDADKDKPEDRNKVSLMTVHSAKGLEFTYVYIVGMEETLFPSGGSLMSPADLEEERRLFYVALTRAEKKVTVSFSQTRYRWGNVVSNPPSRFLKEIDEQYMEEAVSAQKTTNKYGGSKDSFDEYDGGSRQVVRTVIVKRPTIAARQPSPDFKADDPSTIQAGMRVEHERFGFGTVEAIEGDGAERKATVAFEAHGTKTLLLRFAKLQIVR